MIHENLFRQVLLEPGYGIAGGKLRIVSGFATANMADRHMKHLQDQNLDISIELIVGMTVQQGIQAAQHSGFCKLVEKAPWGIDLQCRYVVRDNPVHSKLYVWLDKDGNPSKAFCGSANYTLAGFGKSQTESLALADPLECNQFYKHIFSRTFDCTRDHIEDRIRIVSSEREPVQGRDLESVKLSLLISGGKTPAKSGINWGQRPGREPNQAYISVPVHVRRTNFFPPRGEQFTVQTDDGDTFICVRAQDEGKGLHTTQNNSLLGAYLRIRLGLELGAYVTRQDLLRYGRTDVSFYKIDDETYWLDFLPDAAPGDDAELWPNQ